MTNQQTILAGSADENHHIASAAAALGDRLATSRFEWFSERVEACLAKPATDALESLSALILDASADKRDGFGPPQDDINRARRKWLALYEQTYGRPS